MLSISFNGLRIFLNITIFTFSFERLLFSNKFILERADMPLFKIMQIEEILIKSVSRLFQF